MTAWLQPGQPLPPTRYALGRDSAAPGLLAASATLDVVRLEEAYRRGIFPWYSPGQPVLWWSPDPRMVLPVDGFHMPRNLRKTLRRFHRNPACEVRVDTAFERVIAACADTPREGQNGSWIVPEPQAAYRQWHQLGRVHSVETWINGELVGGLYGVNLGRMFFGESMFSWVSDASKVALAALVALCRARGISVIDCQQNTRHLASLGAREWSREQFERHLTLSIGGVDADETGHWTYHPSHWRLLELDAEQPPATAPPRPA